MKQSNLLSEIQKVCGFDQVTEEKLCRLPYLAAVFHETLRKHSPVPIVPLRYVHEETQLGGYNIPEGTEVVILVAITYNQLSLTQLLHQIFSHKKIFQMLQL